MPHLLVNNAPTPVNKVAERHYRRADEESIANLNSALEEHNRGKIVNGVLRLPTIYVTPDEPEVTDRESHACACLASDLHRFERQLGPSQWRDLHQIYNEMGSAGLGLLQAVPDFVARHQDELFAINTWAGGGNYAVTRRLGEFSKGLANYEEALNAYLLNQRADSGRRQRLRQNALRASRNLNAGFAQEIEVLARNSRYRTWLYNPYTRFPGGIESSFRSSGGVISSLPETLKLRRVLNATQILGKGLIAVDLVGRGINVATSDNKTRAFAREAFSFGASMGGALLAYKGALFTVALIGSLSPLGSVILVISLVGAGAAGAYYGDSLGKHLFDRFFTSQRKALIE